MPHVWLSICIVKCQSTYTNTNLPAYPSTWILPDLPTNSPLISQRPCYPAVIRYIYEIIGHSGESDWLPFVKMGEAPKDRVERYAVIEAMTDHAATARSGDNTLSAGVTWFEWNVVQYENLYSFLKISPLKSIKSSQFRNLRQTSFTFDVNWNPGLPDFPIITNEQRLDLPKVKAVQEMLGVLTWSSLVKGY